MSKLLSIVSLLFASISPASAHWGHVGELAGHGHLIGIGALVAAAALAAALLRPKNAEVDELDEADIDAESADEGEPA